MLVLQQAGENNNMLNYAWSTPCLALLCLSLPQLVVPYITSSSSVSLCLRLSLRLSLSLSLSLPLSLTLILTINLTLT
jgi:hypothetical protein